MFVNFFFKDLRMKFTEIKSKKKKWQKSLKMISFCWKINFFFPFRSFVKKLKAMLVRVA